jgi:hypothetical protein
MERLCGSVALDHVGCFRLKLFPIAAGMRVGRRHVGEVVDFSLYLDGNRFDTSTARLS